MARHLVGLVSTGKLSKVCLAMNTLFSKFASLVRHNLGVRAGVFCNVCFDFHATRENCFLLENFSLDIFLDDWLVPCVAYSEVTLG